MKHDPYIQILRFDSDDTNFYCKKRMKAQETVNKGHLCILCAVGDGDREGANLLWRAMFRHASRISFRSGALSFVVPLLLSLRVIRYMLIGALFQANVPVIMPIDFLVPVSLPCYGGVQATMMLYALRHWRCVESSLS